MHSDSQAVDDPSITSGTTRTFPARLAIVPETAAFVEGFCAGHGMGRDDALRLVLIVEELVSNTIMHGHRTECDAPITLTLRSVAEGVALLYEDTAPAFDFTAALSHAEDPLDTEFDARPVGNLGLRLLAHFSGNVRYAHENGGNRVWLTLRRPDP
jgi:anti-sigma regulatory factor (Ser/Thr protein kinase)